MIELRGITWDHTRGHLPMVATAQRFSELNAGIAILWEKRSLQQFADWRIEQLAERFDLLVIDHPLVGRAAESGCLLPLDEHAVPSSSVGRSDESYCFAGHQWALAIDAAAPVSGWRPDLLAAAHADVPETWQKLLELARRGLVTIPGAPIDTLMNFYMLCLAIGEEPFARPGDVVSMDTGLRALRMLRELAGLVPSECATLNPIAIWEQLSCGDSAAFCPFGYGYSNYSRRRYAKHIVEFGGLIVVDGRRCRSTLGGAGLAVSSQSKQPAAAVDYCRLVASPECQAGLYFDAGGQPAHRAAWLDPEVNRRCNQFFQNTLVTIDDAWLRPRCYGYPDFQDAAAPLVHQCVWRGGDAPAAIDRLRSMFHETT
jgi:multiple sugar transport system substrate-binding protein